MKKIWMDVKKMSSLIRKVITSKANVLALITLGIFSIITVSAVNDLGFYGNAAIDYILTNHEELGDLEIPSSWETEFIPSENGAFIKQYTGDGWTVKFTYPIHDFIYTVEVEYTGKVSFHWEGAIEYDGNVVETIFTVL